MRHLAWICHAPSLVSAPEQFNLAAHLPDNIKERLVALDDSPAVLLDHLAQKHRPRLGHYFEQLYHFLITRLMGWELLLANTQITKNGRTLGELDFVVKNPATDKVEHHEIAIKFYLGVSSPGHKTLWYGPNAQDRLDLKTHRIRHHQIQLTDEPAARSALAAAGIYAKPVRRLFMPGYLFYPLDMPTLSIGISPPDDVPPEHTRGTWCPANALTTADVAGWSVLNKPHWLGPNQCAAPPDPDEAHKILHQVQAGGPPRLLAKMQKHTDGDCWLETERRFIVPDHWPDGA